MGDREIIGTVDITMNAGAPNARKQGSFSVIVYSDGTLDLILKDDVKSEEARAYMQAIGKLAGEFMNVLQGVTN